MERGGRERECEEELMKRRKGLKTEKKKKKINCNNLHKCRHIERKGKQSLVCTRKK
jgi:hypothetical protein